MKLRSDSFRPYDHLDARLAFGKWDPDSKIALSDNLNPHLAWDDVPEGTKSFVVLCYDPDVPGFPDGVNKEGETVELHRERSDFFHWVLADLPADVREIPQGSHSSGITPRGKPPGASPHGGRLGRNSYTEWFEGDADMQGQYFGYDGPCPPWNDERMHGYRFLVVALDTETLDLPETFDGDDVLEAMGAHMLDQGEIIGLYAINPKLKG